jgi:hypothetical protein
MILGSENNSMKGKKVLYLGPLFFGYEKDIVHELESKGATVDFFDERPFKSSIGKALIRLKINFLIKNHVNHYYQQIIEKAKKVEYDYLFVISPETINEHIITKIKASNPNMKSYLYMWDSLANKKTNGCILNTFDHAFSFDRDDASSNESLEFLPLFYGKNYQYMQSDNRENKYSVVFIGTLHSDRFNFVKTIINQLTNDDHSAFTFFYCPSRLLFLLKKIFSNEFNDVKWSDVSFRPLNQKEIKDIVAESKMIIDLEHPSQTGLTLRTIESLGSRKKLITTNQDITNYDFFSDNNICVVDRVNPRVAQTFIESKFLVKSEQIEKQYSLKYWLNTIFQTEECLKE